MFLTMTSPWNIRGSTWTGGGPSCESTRCTASWRWSRPRPLTLAIHVVYNHLIVTCIIISAYIYSYYIWLYIYVYIYILWVYIYIYYLCVWIVRHCGALWGIVVTVPTTVGIIGGCFCSTRHQGQKGDHRWLSLWLPSINGILMGFNGILMGFYSDAMGY